MVSVKDQDPDLDRTEAEVEVAAVAPVDQVPSHHRDDLDQEAEAMMDTVVPPC